MSVFYDWKYIDEEHVAQLERCFDEGQLKGLLFQFFCVDAYDAKKQKIAVDFYFYNYAFCKKNAFDARRISTFMSIMHEIFIEDIASDSLTNNAETSFQRFQALILKHSIERSPKSVQIFLPADVEPLVEFALNSYFRHYSMYSYIFRRQTMVTIQQYAPSGVHYPKVGLPLASGEQVLNDSSAAEHE